MKYDSYGAVKIADDLSSFDFVSSGAKGDIPKRIAFIATAVPNLFVLAFGNITGSNEIDDYSVSDNGDRDRILATIAAAVDLFTKSNAARMIYFIGSTKARTRLYRMAIGLNFEEVSIIFLADFL